MERIKSLKRPEILKALQNCPKYRGQSQKSIIAQLGDIHQCRIELDLLTNQFYYYEQLPYELQNLILLYSGALKYYPRLCKRTNAITDCSYFNQYGNKPLTRREIANYLKEMKPERFLLYDSLGIYTCHRFYGESLHYYISLLYHCRDEINISTTDFITISDIDDLNLSLNLDLKTRLAIFQRRQFKVRATFQFIDLKEIDSDDYIVLLYKFRILRLNCKQFNLPVPKDIYRYFCVVKKITYKNYTMDELIIKLKDECCDMRIRLIDHLKNDIKMNI